MTDYTAHFTDTSHAFVFNGDSIPDYMVPGLVRYFVNYIDPGSFLRAVLSNDLLEACKCADENNLTRIHVYAAYLYQLAPIGSYGSPEAVRAWLAPSLPEAED